MPDHTYHLLLIEERAEEYFQMKSLLSQVQGATLSLKWVESVSSVLDMLNTGSNPVSRFDLCLVGESIFRADIAGIQALMSHQQCLPLVVLVETQEVGESLPQKGAADFLVREEITPALLLSVIRYGVERQQVQRELQQVLYEKRQLAGAIASLKTGVVITDPNQPQNPIVYVNPAFLQLTGYSEAEVLGQTYQFLQGAAVEPLQPEQEGYTKDQVLWRKDGSSFPVESTRQSIWNGDQLVGTVVVFQDITDRKLSEEALRESEERYALAVQGASDGIWDWNLKTGKVYFSPRWKAMLGFQEDEIGSTLEDWLGRIHPSGIQRVKRELHLHLQGHTSHFESEYQILHRNNCYRWMLSRGLAVRDAEGNATRMAGSQTDISSRKQAEEQLLHDAFHDSLTGLPNRAMLMDRLRHALEIAQRDSQFLFSVLFLDVDRFKVLNDSLGHMVGDCLLVAIAQRLSNCLRPGDTFARLGGDEFVILLEGISGISGATAVANRIQVELARPFSVAGHEIFTSTSIGIALSNTSYEWAEDLLRDADTAMYRAKAQGRARYEIFNATMHQRAVALLQLETDLRWAVERDELRLHYQPVVALRDPQKLVGFEALVRWRHPERGMVSPIEFIPIAEDTGLIYSIGHWVLQEACRQMQQWQEEFELNPPLVVNVNVSGKQFTPKLVEQIQAVLQETRLRPAQLKLEITESMLMENAELAIAILTDLHKLGIQLCIDDFGTGYSSLSYLHRFPIDTLKIDRSFINKLDSDAEQLAIVRTIMTLAWNLGIEVVAEGVETNKQLAQLRSLQCEYAQGYYFSIPVDSEVAALLITGDPPWQKMLAVS